MDAPANPPLQPAAPRMLGRSNAYTAEDLPPRLREWHAPRVNRWERLWVTAGRIALEFLGSGGIDRLEMAAHEHRWIAPGMRWRVHTMVPGSRFELEIHADAKGQAEDPEPLRASVLEEAPRIAAPDPAALGRMLAELPAGARCIVDAAFDAAAWTLPAAEVGQLSWHPLAGAPGRFTAFAARSATPFGLAAYLGRDHAVIEAALGGALAGDAEASAWLRATLARHLAIEEKLVFPAYLAAGGRRGWVDGLMREHDYLRQYLAALDEPLSRRRFLRLLDGHDEKEERVVYPDVLAHVGASANALLAAANRRAAPAA